MTSAARAAAPANDAAGTPGVEAPLALVIADALTALTAEIGDLAYDLGSDEAVLTRHMTSLQAFDRITQVQLALAEILRSSDPVEQRLSAVTLESLAASLRANYAAQVSAPA